MGSLEFLVITNRPLFPSPPLCSVPRRRPPTAPTPAPWRGFPAAFFRRAVAHASPRVSSTAPWLRAGPPPPVPRAQNLLAAATATPPWRARRRAPGPLPARARAPQRPQRPIPLFLLLSPRPQTQEHHRRHPPNAGEPRPPLNSPLRPSPPQINPSSSSYVVPRGSPTLFSSPILHRSVASADADRRRPPGYAEPSPQAATSRPEAT